MHLMEFLPSLWFVPKGRFTSEMEQRVREALDIFGGQDAIRHSMIAVTRTADAPEKLLDDIMRLPQDHTLRRLCELVDHRVLPIENVKEPSIAVSRLLLHRGIDEILELNNDEKFFAPKSTLSVGLAKSFQLDLPQARCSTKWSTENGPRLVITCDFPSPGVKDTASWSGAQKIHKNGLGFCAWKKRCTGICDGEPVNRFGWLLTAGVFGVWLLGCWVAVGSFQG